MYMMGLCAPPLRSHLSRPRRFVSRRCDATRRTLTSPRIPVNSVRDSGFVNASAGLRPPLNLQT